MAGEREGERERVEQVCVEARVRPLLTRSLSLLPVRLHAPMDAPRAPPTDAPVMTRLAHRVSTIFLEKCVCVVFFFGDANRTGIARSARARGCRGGGDTGGAVVWRRRGGSRAHRTSRVCAPVRAAGENALWRGRKKKERKNVGAGQRKNTTVSFPRPPPRVRRGLAAASRITHARQPSRLDRLASCPPKPRARCVRAAREERRGRTLAGPPPHAPPLTRHSPLSLSPLSPSWTP